MISCMMDYSWRSVGGAGWDRSNWDIMAALYRTTPFQSDDVVLCVYVYGQ